jgi:hypothetical protein
MRKPNPRHRLAQEIKTLTREGKSQKEIAKALQIHRNSVYRYQRNWGLTAWSTIPSAAKEKKILALLRAGVARKRVERLTRTTEYFVRKIAEAHGITSRVDPLSPEQREKLRGEIRRHSDFAVNLSVRYGVSYRRTLKIAHAELGVPAFIGAAHHPPLSSPFPEKPAAAAIEKAKPDEKQIMTPNIVEMCVKIIESAVRALDDKMPGDKTMLVTALANRFAPENPPADFCFDPKVWEQSRAAFILGLTIAADCVARQRNAQWNN